MTIKDLAAQTGYSVGTVSRVLNHQPHVSDQAREVILRAAREAEFELNTNAKQLKQQHSTAILVICKGRANQLFDHLLLALQDQAGDGPYPLTVDYIDETENEVRRALHLCREKKPLGILFFGGNRQHFQEDFRQIRVPCVLVTSPGGELPWQNLSSVTADDEQAARMAVEQLLDLGHRNIGVIGGSREHSDITALRYRGCLHALEARGLPFPESRYETVRYSHAEGYRGAQALLEREPSLTAIFAMSDTMAIGAIRALRDAGKRVPEDVSVVGFDGLTIGEYTIPRLTTVEQPLEALAARAMALLRQGIESHTAGIHETLPVHLLWKESVRAIPAK